MQAESQDKLVVVTRRDLSVGQQAVQSAHALIDFTFEHPDRAGPWHNNSNYLVLVTVENEQELTDVIEKCQEKFLDYTVFREPDIGNLITAVAIEPSPVTQKLISKFKLLS